jgi:hypothetical protein
MYNILTGDRPYQEVSSDEVRRLYQSHEFPNVSWIPCGEMIERCWRGEINFAQEIIDYMGKVYNLYEDHVRRTCAGRG